MLFLYATALLNLISGVWYINRKDKQSYLQFLRKFSECCDHDCRAQVDPRATSCKIKPILEVNEASNQFMDFLR